MKKNIYGIVDIKTGNFGDICLLDRDEEFLEGCRKLFLNPDVPKYIVEDLIAVRYGSISYNSKQLYPEFSIDQIPTVVLFGRDVIPLRKDDDDEEIC